VVVAITDYLSAHPAQVRLQELLFDALGFLQLTESFGEHSLCELTLEHGGEPRLAIHNLVPADFLAPRFAACQGVALFSATLNPYHYHRDLLGLPENTLTHAVASPFAAEQLEVRLVSGISTRLRDRADSVTGIVHRIRDQFQARPANYLVYLSSFAYLELLQSTFIAMAPEIPVRWQRRGMTATERQDFIDSFQEGGHQVVFAVLGGVFSEGIDLPGSRLTGVFVLTLGLPPHDARHEVLCQRLQHRFGHGYEYTYLYPGLQKVVQAAGRVIRTPEDQGIIELIDDRFFRPEVQQLLPAWWPEPQAVHARPTGMASAD
jgi:DNA excision repair protein ERCC-2